MKENMKHVSDSNDTRNDSAKNNSEEFNKNVAGTGNSRKN